MEGKKIRLKSQHYHSQHHLEPEHHQNQQHQPGGAAGAGAFSNPISVSLDELNAKWSSPLQGIPSSGIHYPTSEGTPLIFLPHSVTGKAPVASSSSAEPFKKKRGRPRKYGKPEPAPSDNPSFYSRGKTPVTSASSLVISPAADSRKTEKSLSSKKAQLAALGQAGQGFTPHVITVSTGEDVAQSILSFIQREKRSVCVLSATGYISKATLSHPAAERNLIFEEVGGANSITGGLGVCMAGVNREIVGGVVVGGPFYAAEPVQVVFGSFLIDNKRVVSGRKKAVASSSKSPSSLAGATSSNVDIGQFGSIPVRGNDEQQKTSLGLTVSQP